jgi:ABC-type polysaccharide/polyol phosphate export permease
MIWAFLGPLFMVAMLTALFSQVLGIKSREVIGDSSLNFGLFLYCGILPFNAYSHALNLGVNVIRKNSNFVREVVFPLEILPLTTMVTSLVESLLGVGALMVVLLVIQDRLHLTALLLPLIMIPQLLFVLGLTYLMAVVGTYVPDIRETLKAFVRATFFITPILYPTGKVPPDWQFLVHLNPLAYLVNTYRGLIIYGELPSLQATINFSLFAAAVFIVGLVVFNQAKRNFADLL